MTAMVRQQFVTWPAVLMITNQHNSGDTVT